MPRPATAIVCTAVVLLALAAGSFGCGRQDAADKAGQPPRLPGQPSGVFTPARPTLGAAFNDFFHRRPVVSQPLDFPHNLHIEQGMTCTDYCHESAMEGPVAGLPSLNTCMICHEVLATDRPSIQRIAALYERGLDLQWGRVYGYPAAAHVRFDHAPHLRADVQCATCHGNVAEQTVAQLNTDLTMGFCVGCHTERNASNDCYTCHN